MQSVGVHVRPEALTGRPRARRDEKEIDMNSRNGGVGIIGVIVIVVIILLVLGVIKI